MSIKKWMLKVVYVGGVARNKKKVVKKIILFCDVVSLFPKLKELEKFLTNNFSENRNY